MQRSREAEQAAAARGSTEEARAGKSGGEALCGQNGDAEGAEMSLSEETLSAVVRGKKVQLKAKEFALLKCLYDNRNKIVTKENLFLSVWGDECYGDGTLNVHIRKLREKLEENPGEPKLIQTVWGVGYMLAVTV